MKLDVDSLDIGVGQNNDKNIQIRLSGEDIKFIATEYSVSIFIDEDLADRLAFHIGAVLQDIKLKKLLTNPV